MDGVTQWLRAIAPDSYRCALLSAPLQSPCPLRERILQAAVEQDGRGRIALAGRVKLRFALTRFVDRSWVQPAAAAAATEGKRGCP